MARLAQLLPLTCITLLALPASERPEVYLAATRKKVQRRARALALEEEEAFVEEAGRHGHCKRSEERNCTDKEALREAFRHLGVPAADLPQDPCKMDGVTCWQGCVVRIEWADQNVEGSLESLEEFCELETVDLSGTRVTGSLSSLQGLTQLVTVDLSGTAISGFLAPMASLTQLRQLSLSRTKISGGLDPLKQLQHLETLRLDDTQVKGTLLPLAGLQLLQELELSDTKISGDLDPLKQLQHLKSLWLDGTQVKGTLLPLAGLQQLRQLSLSYTKISGDLDPLVQLQHLETLQLDGTQIKGTLLPLAGLQLLRELSLSYTKISGDLDPLVQLQHLKTLGLDDTHVKGTLLPLAGLQQLRQLLLSYTKISGDLDPLKPLQHLDSLWLGGTQVKGTLLPLAGLQLLKELVLRGTEITGELEPLKQLQHLETLRLDDTHVRGTLLPLAGLQQLRQLSLSRTKISGDLDPLVQLQHLETLQLHDTQVKGTLLPLAGLQQLRQLLLSRTKISGDLDSLKQLAGLQELSLAKTHVKGDVSQLCWFTNLQKVDLSFTYVGGRLTTSWRGQLKHLRSLKLADSRVSFLPVGDDLQDLRGKFFFEDAAMQLLPALVTLDVSGCLLNGPVQNLLQPLLASTFLAEISANRANLSGELQDMLHLQDVAVDGISHASYFFTNAVQVLQLSDNRISRVSGFSAKTYASIANNSATQIDAAVLRRVLEENLQLDVTGTRVSNAKDIQDLFDQGDLKRTAETTYTDTERGFACYDVTAMGLGVTPPLFWQGLCACHEGFEGDGTLCHKCAVGSYNKDFNSSCVRCPANSTTAEAGAGSVKSCACEIGRMMEDALGQMACQCEAASTLYQNTCEDCGKLHLDCPRGTQAETADPQAGYARLVPGASMAFRCLAAERCNATGSSSELGCATGYEGPLCVTCASNFRSQSGGCTECMDGSADSHRAAVAVASFVAVTVAVAGTAYLWRPSAEELPTEQADACLTVSSVLQPLLLAQGSVLLQLFQLWGVLAALSGRKTQGGGGGGGRFKELWEQEYVQWLQFTAQGLRDALSLECTYGRTARSISALAAPLVPLLMLALCMLVEVWKEGRGVSLALKVLTALFIGGASSCAVLLGCREVDGGGELLTEPFRIAFPHLSCEETGEEAAWADLLGPSTAIVYGIIIPGFLLYLMVKQHKALAPSRRFMCGAEQQGHEIIVFVKKAWNMDLAPVKEEADWEATEQCSSKHLLAMAVAVSLNFPGRVRLELREGLLIVQPSQAKQDQQTGAFDVDMAVWSAMQSATDAEMRRCQAIARMLTERAVFEELVDSDRILAGAKELFFKYAACQDVWFEVAMKLVAVALVSVVATEKGLEMTLGFTLTAAMALGCLRPYRQRQVNDLHCFCFACLGAAAVGFARGWAALARGALVAPFLLAGAQALRPDGHDAMALHLFKVAEARWPALKQKEVVELLVETRT